MGAARVQGRRPDSVAAMVRVRAPARAFVDEVDADDALDVGDEPPPTEVARSAPTAMSTASPTTAARVRRLRMATRRAWARARRVRGE